MERVWLQTCLPAQCAMVCRLCWVWWQHRCRAWNYPVVPFHPALTCPLLCTNWQCYADCDGRGAGRGVLQARQQAAQQRGRGRAGEQNRCFTRAEARPGVDGLLQSQQEQERACSMPAGLFATIPVPVSSKLPAALSSPPTPPHPPPPHPRITFQIVICVFVAGELARAFLQTAHRNLH